MTYSNIARVERALDNPAAVILAGLTVVLAISFFLLGA
jgi:hypothetical protein